MSVNAISSNDNLYQTTGTQPNSQQISKYFEQLGRICNQVI